MTYDEFIESKRFVVESSGFEPGDLNSQLFGFQKDIVTWAIKRGRSAIFAGCGLGKTPMQLEWAKHVHEKTGGNVLVLAPLAVSKQTVREGEKFGITVHPCRSPEDVKPGINITNYEILHKFDNEFSGVVLDESSILKSYTAKTRNEIIDRFERTPYKLACTATPAPNDFMELGNHAEFLNVMTRTEMLSMFFVHDGGETQKWRLKGHAEMKFWEWVSSWGVVLEKPSDLGYDDDDFLLPPLRTKEIVVEVEKQVEGSLFGFEAKTLQERQSARRETVEERAKAAADIANNTHGPVMVWCDRNAESEMLSKLIPDAVEVKGSDSPEHKENAMIGFADGEIRVLVSKPSIAGFGMNWQHCSKMIFVGLSDSFEQYYQAVRRCWRFGQTKPVDVFVITSSLEGAVIKNIRRKEEDAQTMLNSMIAFTKHITSKNIRSNTRETTEYLPTQTMRIPSWLKEEQLYECV